MLNLTTQQIWNLCILYFWFHIGKYFQLMTSMNCRQTILVSGLFTCGAMSSVYE